MHPIPQAPRADTINGAGVYAIRNRHTGRCYVGSSANIADQLTADVYALNARAHECAALQAAWEFDGEFAFEFTVLELVEHLAQMPACEELWLNTLCPLGLYNSGHNGHPDGRTERHGMRAASWPSGPAHLLTSRILVNPFTGKHRIITQEECHAVFQSRPLVRNVLRRVLAEGYMREHPDSGDVMRAIVEDWERPARS